MALQTARQQMDQGSLVNVVAVAFTKRAETLNSDRNELALIVFLPFTHDSVHGHCLCAEHEYIRPGLIGR